MVIILILFLEIYVNIFSGEGECFVTFTKVTNQDLYENNFIMVNTGLPVLVWGSISCSNLLCTENNAVEDLNHHL